MDVAPPPEAMVPRKTDKVIAHFLDGTLVKGTTHDFYPSRVKFTIKTSEDVTQQIQVNELKALFFVKDFKGKPQYRERKGFFKDTDPGNKVLVEFFDGEILFGYTITYSGKGNGFFMSPGDPDSNNIKVFVVHGSTKRIKVKQARRKERRRKSRKPRKQKVKA
jgi:hypothetical protein